VSSTYDALIQRHYDAVAEQAGAQPTSTMADEIVRARETAAILDFVAACAGGASGLSVLDVGCGNGYTLHRLLAALPGHRYLGVEHNAKLRGIAAGRATVIPGDLRDLATIELAPASADVVICQRVIINIMDLADQRRALENVVALAKPGAGLLFIEVFASALAHLNEARAEFEFEPIPPAVHNLPLPDDFFTHPALAPFPSPYGHAENELSTHYFVSRVLHPAMLKATSSPHEFIRNSHFVRFFSAALPDGIGDYSPLRIKVFSKRPAG
jgi:SAM-dependent methyltransferase